MRLLLAEDEEMMAEAVTAYLEYHGHRTDWVQDGPSAFHAARSGTYDCLILDVMMPGMDGFEVLRALRGRGDSTPAIFLTAKAEISDKLEGFRAGGDDYLTKPFSLEELLARLNALALRGRVHKADEILFADLVLDRNACLLKAGEKSCTLSHRELRLMAFLMLNPHMYFSADALLDRVWGIDAEVEQGTVWVHISYLRKKMEALGTRAVIVSKRNIGYALEEAP